MTAKVAQAVNDAQLEADAWRETAARWRKRALREAAPWRRKCRKLEAELDDANERGAELAEKAQGLEDSLAEKNRPIERELGELRKDFARTEKERRSFEQELSRLKAKMGTAGTVESLIVERDVLKEQIAEQKSRVSLASSEATKASSRAYKAEQDAADTKERYAREAVMPARARLRVLATRLGIAPAWPGYSDDDQLTAELDKRIVELQQRAG